MIGHQHGFAIGSEGESHGILADGEHLLLAVRIGGVDHVDQPIRSDCTPGAWNRREKSAA
jgi:hypothetical protein